MSSESTIEVDGATMPVTLGQEDQYDWDHINWLKDIERCLRDYVIGSIIVFGSIGNILSVITLQTKSFRGTTSGFVLTALALADLVVLNSGAMHEVLINNDIDMSEFSSLSCKIQYYAQTVSVQISAWTLVLLTVERMVAVVWPHKVHIICTRKKIIILWSCTVAFLLMASAYHLILMDIQHYEDYDEDTNTTDKSIFCTYDDEYEQKVDDFTYWYDFLVGAVMPTALILAANCIIVKTLGQRARVKKTQVAGSAASLKTSSVTVMLIVVSLVFIITTWPSRIYAFGMDAWFPNTDEDPLERQQENVAFTVVTTLLYINFAINFALYLTTGTRFRKAFCGLFRCCRVRAGGQMGRTASTGASVSTSQCADSGTSCETINI